MIPHNILDFPEQNNNALLTHLYSEQIDENTYQFWRRSLLRYCLLTDHILIDIDQFIKEYTINGLVPASFDICINHTEFSIDLLDNQTLESSSSDSYYGTERIYSYLFIQSKKQKCILYIPLLNMLELCINNYLHNTPNNERVHEFVIVQDGECTLRDFLLEAARQCHDSAISKLLNALTRQVEWRTLIRYMQRRGTAVVSDDGELVKFVGPGPAQPMTAFNYFVRYFYSTPTSAGITESERAIVHLRQTLRMLKARIEKLETQMARYKSEAASYKTKGDKRMTQMKFKLLVETEKQRQSTASTLLKLEGVYSDISAAETNMAVLACYKSATIALRESRRVTQSDGSVSVVDMESIQDVISAFEEEMQISQDIGETLGQSQEDATDEDLEELEAALAALSTSDTAPATNHSQSTMSSTTPLHVEPPINDPVLSCQDPPKHIPVPTKQTTEEKETVSY